MLATSELVRVYTVLLSDCSLTLVLSDVGIFLVALTFFMLSFVFPHPTRSTLERVAIM